MRTVLMHTFFFNILIVLQGKEDIPRENDKTKFKEIDDACQGQKKHQFDIKELRKK